MEAHLLGFFFGCIFIVLERERITKKYKRHFLGRCVEKRREKFNLGLFTHFLLTIYEIVIDCHIIKTGKIESSRFTTEGEAYLTQKYDYRTVATYPTLPHGQAICGKEWRNAFFRNFQKNQKREGADALNKTMEEAIRRLLE